jgi:hypothetical protein
MTHAELVQPQHHPLGARATHLAKTHERRFELARVREMQSEDVRFRVALDGAQLDTGDEAHTEGRRLCRRFGDAGHGVVIGERDRRQSGAVRGAHHIGRRARPVGRGRVRVQIDERPLGRTSGGGAGHAV